MTDEAARPRFLSVAWQRRGTVLSVVLIAGAIAMFLSFFRSTPYRTAAGLRVDPLALDRVLEPDQVPVNPPVALIDTEMRLVRSAAVEAAVRSELGEAPEVSTRRVPGTNVIEVTAEASAAGRAAQIADAYASAYVTVRNQQFLEQVTAARGEIQGRVDVLQTQIAELAGRGDLAARDAAAAQQAALRQQLDRLAVRQAAGAAAAELVTPAAVPSSRVSTRPIRTAVTALLAGLIVGIGLALVLDHFDDSVRATEDLALVSGLDVIGSVPEVTSWKVPAEVTLVTVSDARSPAAQAYSSLAVTIETVLSDRGYQTLQVTSPSAREGKTATVANLGVAMARNGHRVLVVCCDLRTPRLHQFFGLSNDVGFTSVLLGKVPLSAAVQEIPEQPGLVLLASGPLPPKPSELLESGRSPEVMRSLRTQADFVLFDSPPVLPGADALAIAGSADAVLLVCAAFRTDRGDARRAAEALDGVGTTPVVGAILNGAPAAKPIETPLITGHRQNPVARR